MKQKKVNELDDAVSPVVGVMLMLVVTIIIAAVVTAFASGIGSETDSAKSAIIKLDNYDMATVTYDGSWGSYSYVGYNDGNPLGLKTTYGPYNMTFMHKGGERLFVDDIDLAITYNGATYYTPLSEINPDIEEWSVGQKLSLTLGPDDIEDLSSGLLFGLSKQNMDQYGGNTFEWSLIDENGYVIVTGIESARL